MIDITPIINALLAVVAILITAYLIPWIKHKTTYSQRENITALVKITCDAAEQLYKVGKVYDRKQYVLDFLENKNLNIDFSELDKMIEAAVLEINKEWNANDSKVVQ